MGKAKKTAEKLAALACAAAVAASTCTAPAAVAAAAEDSRATGQQEVVDQDKCLHNAKFEKVDVEPVGCRDGYMTFVCPLCGKVEKGGVIKSTVKHSWKTTIVKPKKCRNGYVDRKCKVCGLTAKREITKAKTKHRYKAVTVKATCEHDGYTGKKCRVCGKLVKTETLKGGHRWKQVSAGKAATCTEPGESALKVCKVCGKDNGGGKAIPALGHEWSTAASGLAVLEYSPVFKETYYHVYRVFECIRCDENNLGLKGERCNLF